MTIILLVLVLGAWAVLFLSIALVCLMPDAINAANQFPTRPRRQEARVPLVAPHGRRPQQVLARDVQRPTDQHQAA